MSEINFTSLKCYGSKVTPEKLNMLVDILQSVTLMPGVGYNIARGGCGTALRIKPGAVAGATPDPFTVSTIAISGDDSNVTVKVSPGTLNGTFADNVFDTLTASATELNYAKLTVSTDGQNLTTYTIAVDGDAPSPQSATANALPSSFDIPLAIIQSGKAYQTQKGSLQMIGQQSFVVDADPPADPGKLAYTPFFVWSITPV